ncbi:MAG: glycosyltransferase [Candidatus Rokuibacteriota bacterium]
MSTGFLYRPKLRGGGHSRIWWCKSYVTGRPIRESTGMEKETEAKRFLKLREGAVASGAPIPPRVDRVLYEELADDLLTFYRTTGRWKNLADVEHRLAHLGAFFEGYRAGAITRGHVFGHVRAVGGCARLDERAATGSSASPVTLTAVGYTTEMDEYMAAADLLVGKPGGLTTSEALARGLPMVIVNPIPGQEERNAIRCNNLPALAWKLDRLLGEPTRLAMMRDQARQLARPHAARAVVARLLRTGTRV